MCYRGSAHGRGVRRGEDGNASSIARGVRGISVNDFGGAEVLTHLEHGELVVEPGGGGEERGLETGPVYLQAQLLLDRIRHRLGTRASGAPCPLPSRVAVQNFFFIGPLERFVGAAPVGHFQHGKNGK